MRIVCHRSGRDGSLQTNFPQSGYGGRPFGAERPAWLEGETDRANLSKHAPATPIIRLTGDASTCRVWFAKCLNS